MKNTTKHILKQELSRNVTATYIYTDFVKSGDPDVIVTDILNQIKESPNFSLCEYKSEEKLITDLKRKIFGDSDPQKLTSIIPHINKISDIITNTIKKSFKIIPISGNIQIYVIPMCNEAASIDLDGVNAFPLEGNVLYLLIDVNNPNWEKSLKETIPHEYAHLTYTSNFNWNSILDGIVNEGLAEHFRERVVGGDIAPWSTAIEKDIAIKHLNELPDSVINKYIDESNVDLYISYFFGTKELQEWYGYSLGYWLIDEIISKTELDLIELFKLSPKDIFDLFIKNRFT